MGRRPEAREVGAVGFRLHTGWAAAVTLGGSPSAPRVLDRRRFSLVEKADHDSVFVFHAAAELGAAAAETHVAKAREVAQARASGEMARLLSDLAGSGVSLRAAGVPRGAHRPLPAFADVLRSHPLLHTAEGELFRTALVEACDRQGVAVVRVASKGLLEQVAQASGVQPEALKRRLVELGRGLGPPWATDQREAALAALAASASLERH